MLVDFSVSVRLDNECNMSLELEDMNRDGGFLRRGCFYSRG